MARAAMDAHLAAYFVGIFVVFASHLYTLLRPRAPLMSMRAHCYANILAAGLIAFYFVHREYAML